MELACCSSIVVICRDPRREELIDELLADPHDFDMIFVESIARGYARIKDLRPDLVVLFTALNDEESFQLLSMLAIDRDTRGIPVVTYASSRERDNFAGVIGAIRRHLPSRAEDRMN